MMSCAKLQGKLINCISKLAVKTTAVPTFKQDLSNQKVPGNDFCSFPAMRIISANFPANKDLDVLIFVPVMN